MSHSTRIIIPGPPGTGKTFTLTKYLERELNEHKTDPQKIAYISFSNAAANEAQRRINHNLFHIGTMHSLGSNALGINTQTQLLKGSKWNSFKNYSQVCKDLSFESTTNEFGYVVYTNPHMKIIEYARSRQIDIEEAAIQLDLHQTVEVSLTELIDSHLKTYKEHTGMIEYYDMIAQFIEKKVCPQLDVVFLDEAQDLSPLQWKMFFYIESICKRSYIAGDDDQTIYTFQGADPKIFINLKGKFDPQIKSRRVPRKIHNLAESIFPYMSERLDKQWEARDAEGNIYEDMSLEDLNLSKGNWMILARTNKMLDQIKEHLYSLNLRFSAKTQEILPTEMVNAYRVWDRLNKGAKVDKQGVKDLWQYLKTELHVARGFKNEKKLETIVSVDMQELREQYGLRATGSWEHLNFPQESKTYIKNLLESGDDLMKEPRIKVSTIHSVKGEEADNVALYTDLERIIYESALKDPDPEHRTFFVGITRAKENLYLMQSTSDYQYNIGGPIV
jgi:DNA helicase II / ATP-dependent DNA helicase PcrA